MTDTTEKKTRPRRKLWTAIILLGTLVLFFGVLLPAFGNFYIAVNTKDVRYDTAVFAAEVVDKYVNAQDPPRWPSSWSELAAITYKTDGYYWPEDQDFVQRFVTIDFSVSYDDVSRSDWPAKPPISPRGWSQRGWEKAVWEALKRNATPE